MSATAQALAAESCAACRPDSPRVPAAEAEALLANLPDWSIVVEETERLAATFAFADFAAAFEFAGRVGDLAEAANHHPMLIVEWGMCKSSGGRTPSAACTATISFWRRAPRRC